MGGGSKMNTEGIPSCEWPDTKRSPKYRNCFDKNGCMDRNLQRSAAKNRIEGITKQLDCPHGLTNKERHALANERQRCDRKFSLGSYFRSGWGNRRTQGKSDGEKAALVRQKKGWLKLICRMHDVQS